MLPSADLWWVLADGQLVSRGSIPTSDPFSYTAPGAPWHNDQWLAGWFFYRLYQFGGLTALQAFKSLWLCLLFAAAMEWLHRRTGHNGLAVVLAGTLCTLFSEYAYFYDVRAYLFSYALLVGFWIALSHYSRGGSARVLLLLPPLTALWANLHAAVVAGLVMLGLACLAQPRERLRPLLWVTGLATLASMCNPQGYHILTHAVRLLGSPWGRHLNEWQPLWAGEMPARLVGYLVFLPATLMLLVAYRTRLSRTEIVILTGFGLLSITGWRHIPVFCWLAPLPWAFLTGKLPLRTRAWTGPVLGLAAMFLALGWLSEQPPLERQSLESLLFPRWAAQVIEDNLPGERIFHPYGWGGYLLWRLGPKSVVTIDGRAAQVYPVEVYLEYLRAVRDHDALRAFLDRHQVAVALLANHTGLEADVALLEGDPEFREIYRDDLCVLLVRNGHQPQSVQLPPSPYRLCQEAQHHPERGLLLADRALALDPYYAPAWFLRGSLRLRQGDDLGEGDLRQAIRYAPSLSGPRLNLAIYYARSDPKQAIRLLREELRLNPDLEPAQRLLRELTEHP